MLHFQLRGVEVRVHGVRQDVPPRLERIDYEIVVDTDEVDARLALLHENVKKYGTVFNTVAPGTSLQGVLHRGPARTTPDPPDDPGPVIRLNESQQRHLAVFLQQLDRGLAEVEQLATAPPSRAILRIEQDDLPPDYAASIRDDLHELRERIHALVHRLELQPSERSRRRRTLALLLTMIVQLEDAGSSGLRGYGPVDASVPAHLDPALAAMRTALQRMGAVLEGTGPASGTPPPLNP
jgi:hypothetical protein